MGNHPIRGRINCAPLSLLHANHGLLMGLPKTIEPLAYTYGLYPLVPDGALIRVKSTGRVCKWTGGAVQNVDQRKATAALNLMQIRIDENYDWRNTKRDREAAWRSGEGVDGIPENS